MDGSRIEGSHKAWNSLQRSHSSGIEVYIALAFDFFLRRNIRIGWSRVESERRGINCYEFVASTYSSHHVQLVNYTANLFNSLLDKDPANTEKYRISRYPTLPKVNIQESMGLVESAHTITFGGLVKVQPVPPTSDMPVDTSNTYMLEDIEEQISEMDQGQLIRSLNVDEHMLNAPLVPQTGATAHQPRDTDLNTPRQLQKRKERTESKVPIEQAQEISHGDREDTPSGFKRRRTAGPLSPSTQAEIGLSRSSSAGLSSIEVDETSPMNLEVNFRFQFVFLHAI